MNNNEVYVSTDIESDGPIPGHYSMLSVGSVVFHEDGRILHEFSANLDRLPGARQHPDTMKFWEKHPDAWDIHRKNIEPAFSALKRYCEWLEFVASAFGKPIFVGFPVAYDFMFVCWYLNALCNKCPFDWYGIDIKTYAMALLGTKYAKTSKSELPGQWLSQQTFHAHVALADALHQGYLFRNMLNFRRGVVLKEIKEVDDVSYANNFKRDTDSYKTSGS